ncbi:MAG: hypothetical protein DBX37_05990 [Massilioclostridium sp.]|nr:MAG: hypothetical protein DBX37_05990 [Massilioclostridium sp.]
MKKVISIALALCLCLVCFVGCGEKTYDGWEKVEFGEVSYQVDKSWRARSTSNSEMDDKTMEYYVDQNLSFGVQYTPLKNLSESNKTDHSVVEEYWFDVYVKEDPTFEVLSEYKVAGKMAYHCKRNSPIRIGTGEYYGIDTPKGYVIFYANYSDTIDTNIVEDNFAKLLDSVNIVKEKSQPEPKVEKSGEYKGWKTEQVAEFTFKVPQEWENSPNAYLDARSYEIGDKEDNLSVSIGLQEPQYEDKEQFLDAQQKKYGDKIELLEDTTIAEEEAKHYTLETFYRETVIYDIYLLDSPSGVVRIQSQYPADLSENPLKDDFDKILQSFEIEK